MDMLTSIKSIELFKKKGLILIDKERDHFVCLCCNANNNGKFDVAKESSRHVRIWETLRPSEQRLSPCHPPNWLPHSNENDEQKEDHSKEILGDCEATNFVTRHQNLHDKCYNLPIAKTITYRNSYFPRIIGELNQLTETSYPSVEVFRKNLVCQ